MVLALPIGFLSDAPFADAVGIGRGWFLRPGAGYWSGRLRGRSGGVLSEVPVQDPDSHTRKEGNRPQMTMVLGPPARPRCTLATSPLSRVQSGMGVVSGRGIWWLERGAALTLAWRSVIGACFALPRDAGRRPALRPDLEGYASRRERFRRLGSVPPAALRAAVPAPTGRTGRRSAFQAVPALFRGRRCAISLRFAQRCRCEAPTGRTDRRSLLSSAAKAGSVTSAGAPTATANPLPHGRLRRFPGGPYTRCPHSGGTEILVHREVTDA